MNKFTQRQKNIPNHCGIISWNDFPNSTEGSRTWNYFEVKKNGGNLVKQAMDQPGGVNGIGALCDPPWAGIGQREGREPALFLLIVFICSLDILGCTHGKVSCPDKYSCSPACSACSSTAPVMERGFISRGLMSKLELDKDWWIVGTLFSTAGSASLAQGKEGCVCYSCTSQALILAQHNPVLLWEAQGHFLRVPRQLYREWN